MLQFECLLLATGVYCYESSMQIYVYLGVTFFAAHINALAASIDSMLADVGNNLVRQLGRYLC